MINKQLAIIDPKSVFKSPYDVLAEQSLSRQEKITSLKNWAYDERELAVAEEENMLATSHALHTDTLSDVLKALLVLGVTSDQENPPPTKQG